MRASKIIIQERSAELFLIVSFSFIILGALNNLHRNQVKLHDNVLFLTQRREDDEKERKLQTAILTELRDEIKVLVSYINRVILRIKKKYNQKKFFS